MTIDEKLEEIFCERDRRAISHAEMKQQIKYLLEKAYNYGQYDCGEFGAVMGFEEWLLNANLE